VVSAFNISYGTLPSIETVVEGNRLISSLHLPTSFTITENTTLEEISSGLVTSNASLRYGDKISVVYLQQVRPARGIDVICLIRN
jgi:hypothetical protein